MWRTRRGYRVDLPARTPVILLSDRDSDRDPPRVLSIYGGKLTGYRATAAKVLRRIEAALPSRKPVADTRRLRLSPP